MVSSLWTVNDLSTAFLMIRFYQNLKSGLTIAKSLNQAQLWLRDVRVAELQEWTSKLRLEEKLVQQIQTTLDWFDSDEQPFFWKLNQNCFLLPTSKTCSKPWLLWRIIRQKMPTKFLEIGVKHDGLSEMLSETWQRITKNSRKSNLPKQINPLVSPTSSKN